MLAINTAVSGNLKIFWLCQNTHQASKFLMTWTQFRLTVFDCSSDTIQHLTEANILHQKCIHALTENFVYSVRIQLRIVFESSTSSHFFPVLQKISVIQKNILKLLNVTLFLYIYLLNLVVKLDYGLIWAGSLSHVIFGIEYGTPKLIFYWWWSFPQFSCSMIRYYYYFIS